MMKECGVDAHLIQEAEQAIEKSAQVNDEQSYMDFQRRDVSLIQDNKGVGTIYAVDIDNAPEMNLVERVFRSRDIMLDKGELSIILPEEELKKHQKDPKMNKDEPAWPGAAGGDKLLYEGRLGKEIMAGSAGRANKASSPGRRMLATQPEDARGGGNPMNLGGSMHQERYCICAKKNDNQQYVQCEDECEWYHPECVGFKQDLFEIKQVKFLCPFCSTDTRKKVQQLEQQGLYKKIKSISKSEYYAYVPEGMY